MFELGTAETAAWRDWFHGMLQVPGGEGRYRAMPVVRESREEAEARGVQVRRASVLLTLFPGWEADGTWTWRAVLMERTPHGGVHGGQVSIPGGEAEPVDAGEPLSTALREFAEEMGVPVAPSAVVGQLAPLYIAPSAFHVEAFVAVLPHEPTWRVDATEVAALLRPRVHDWTHPDALHPRSVVVRPGLRAQLPAYDIDGRTVWGATAIWLTEFADAWHGARGRQPMP